MHKLTVFIASAIIAVAGICVVRAQSTPLPTLPQPEIKWEISAQDNAECTKLIRKYKGWTKINSKPFQMQPQAAAACAAPMPSQSPRSPHMMKYVTVYVNDLGKKAMTTQKSPIFPVGSIILKEKLSKPDSKHPELMTVMVKREKDFNPGCGDWEFMVFSGDGKLVTARGKIESCANCHQTLPALSSDYVFRNYYLPEDKRLALK